MSIFGIIGVELDKDGCVARAVIRQVNPKSNSWMGSPSVTEANQIASLLVKGDTVFGIFIADGQAVHGPKFKRVVFDGGREGIDLEENELGRTVRDLVQHVPA